MISLPMYWLKLDLDPVFIYVLCPQWDCNSIYKCSLTTWKLTGNFATIVTIEMFREYLAAELQDNILICKVKK